MTWAFALDLKPASLKFLLVALSDFANQEGEMFPSLEALCAKTSLDRKTVIAGITELERIGFLTDTGKRVGRTRQVKVYSLTGFATGECDAEPVEAAAIKAGVSDPLHRNSNSTENGMHSDNGTVPIFRRNSTVFPRKQYRKRNPDPKGILKEPLKRTRVTIPDEPPPSNLNVEAWHRWVEYRKQIRKPIQPPSTGAAQRKLAAFGPDQSAVVEQSIADGYQGLFALKFSSGGKTKKAPEWT